MSTSDAAVIELPLPFWIEPLLQQFGRQVSRDRVAHALLLTGTRGQGKSLLAAHMIRTLLCLNRTDSGLACGQCRACLYQQAGTHPDSHLLQPEGSEQIRIDQIRALSARMTQTRSVSPYQVTLLTPAERLNRNAANALLKTLEEPPPNAVMILVANQTDRLPATLKSRCQRLHVSASPAQRVRQWLMDSASCTASEADVALRVNQQAPMAALSFVTSQSLARYLAFEQDLFKVLRSQQDPVALVQEWADQDGDEILRWWVAIVRDAAWADAGQAPDALGSRHRFFQRLLQTRRLLETPVRKDQLYESLLIDWQKSGQGIEPLTQSG